jgi:hypothetical protein
MGILACRCPAGQTFVLPLSLTFVCWVCACKPCAVLCCAVLWSGLCCTQREANIRDCSLTLSLQEPEPRQRAYHRPRLQGASDFSDELLSAGAGVSSLTARCGTKSRSQKRDLRTIGFPFSRIVRTQPSQSQTKQRSSTVSTAIESIMPPSFPSAY